MTLLEDWLTVAGLVLLTAGTGAQALASLAEFRGLMKTLAAAANEGAADLFLTWVVATIAALFGSRKNRPRNRWQRLRHWLWQRTPGWLAIPGAFVLMSLVMFVYRRYGRPLPSAAPVVAIFDMAATTQP